MPNIGTLQTVQQGSIRITSVTSDTLRPANIAIANVNLPAEKYDGEVTFTPQEYAQVIPINGKISMTNITIEPIPQNWGKISYNGYALTVS